MHRKSSQITSQLEYNTITLSKISKFNMRSGGTRRVRRMRSKLFSRCQDRNLKQSLNRWAPSSVPYPMAGPGTLAGGMIAIYYVGTQGSDTGNNGVTGNAGGEVSSASPRVCSLCLSCQTLLFLIQGRNTRARVYNTAARIILAWLQVMLFSLKLFKFSRIMLCVIKYNC